MDFWWERDAAGPGAGSAENGFADSTWIRKRDKKRKRPKTITTRLAARQRRVTSERTTAREATTRTAGLDDTVVGCVEIAGIGLVVEFVPVQEDGRPDRHDRGNRYSPSRERTVMSEVLVYIEDADLIGLCDVHERTEGCVGVYYIPIHEAIVSGVVEQASANLVVGHLSARGAAQESREGVGNRNGNHKGRGRRHDSARLVQRGLKRHLEGKKEGRKGRTRMRNRPRAFQFFSEGTATVGNPTKNGCLFVFYFFWFLVSS